MIRKVKEIFGGKIKMHVRYVNDIFPIIGKGIGINPILKEFNTFDKNTEIHNENEGKLHL